MLRNLDGMYFMTERDGKPIPVCFTDLTEEEIEEIIGERSADWWKSVALNLKECINEIGEQFDLARE